MNSLSKRVISTVGVSPLYRGLTLLFAVAMAGTVYAADGAGSAGTFTDERDAKTYKTVVIGGKTWMAENLNYQTDSSWCYGNKANNCAKYGRLYDWSVAMTACPAGWHLPTNTEWNVLIKAAGGSSVAGRKLKAKSGWRYDNKNGEDGNGTDDYGFSALPGDHRRSDGAFKDIGYLGYWWTASEIISNDAYYRIMDYRHYYVDEDNNHNRDGRGLSVRCVKDE